MAAETIPPYWLDEPPEPAEIDSQNDNRFLLSHESYSDYFSSPFDAALDELIVSSTLYHKTEVIGIQAGGHNAPEPPKPTFDSIHLCDAFPELSSSSSSPWAKYTSLNAADTVNLAGEFHWNPVELSAFSADTFNDT
jgi:hypothetical protein